VWTLGVNWKWHDSAAALIDGRGAVHGFAEEERFTRQKHAWGAFPVKATAYCLRAAGITWADVTAVAVGWDFAHLHRDSEALLAAIFPERPVGAAGPEVIWVRHHVAHALSTFYASGLDEAGVLVVDGSGETDSATIFVGSRTSGLKPLRSWDRRYSLGSLYMAATLLLGFGELDAGKTMGLAPYGASEGVGILPVGDLLADSLPGNSPVGELAADSSFGDFTQAWQAYLASTVGRCGSPSPQLQADPVARRLAATAQETVEAVIRALHSETVALSGHDAVCLAGGVSLNCVANGMLPEPVYVPPFPHDAGVALGAAWCVQPPVDNAGPLSAYLGPDLTLGNELESLREAGCVIGDLAVDDVVAELLAGRLGAVAEGRAEVGPRALGHRSILALPAPAQVQARVNAVKRREPWRPFGPVTLSSHARRLWPSQGARERYMIGTAVVSGLAREIMPAAVHVDGTTRPQSVEASSDATVARILNGLEAAGVYPVLLNTSLNNRGEPIANSAADAVRSFLTLGLDFLVIGGLLVRRPGRDGAECTSDPHL
jgi:carbamoyltransferase